MTYTGQIYSTANPTTEIVETFKIEDLEGFTETSTKTGSDEIKYNLKKGTSWYYYNSGWIASDETYNQSTTAVDTETNKAAYTSIPITFGIKFFLHSDDGSTTPEIDLLAIDYDYAGETADTIERCIISGYVEAPAGGQSFQSLKVWLESEYVQYKTNIKLDQKKESAVYSSVDNRWEIELADTVNMTGDEYYIFEFEDQAQVRRKVPNQDTCEFFDLPTS